MDITKLKRNPSIIKQQLVETKSKQVIAKTHLVLHFPKRYVERDLAIIGIENYVFGIFAIIDDQNNYAISTVPAMLKTTPTRITEDKVGDVPYYNFHYNAGSVIIDNTEVVRKDTIIYSLMEEFFLKGNVPWFVDYEDLGKVFDGAKTYADSNAAKNYATMEALAAFISRVPSDRVKQFRHGDIKGTPSYVGMYGNVFYAAPGTINKLVGSYFQDGVVSALTQKSENVSHVEHLLRS